MTMPRAAAADPLVVLEGVTKRFRADRSLWRRLRGAPGTAPRAVVDALSLTVQRGEILGIVGANGAGKTTLLKLVAGALVPDAGTIRIEGRDAAAVRERIAVVPPDERALFWRASARENVRLMGALYGLRGDALHDAVDEVLDIVGLGHTGEQLVGSFSSGMRQRVLLARALVTRAPLLILDEPTRSLDPVTARELRAFVREVVQHRAGVTVLLATHSTEEALALCDRAALLVRGRLVATDAIPALGTALRGTRVRARVAAEHAARARVLLHLRDGAPVAVEEGWAVLESDLPDASHLPLVLEALVRAGVRVAEYGPVTLSLADLLERAEAALATPGDETEVAVA
ncbi:MAG: ABC transporter ATP-binding protein [Gemmatimonadaceae bacterium]|nr:ABC transporter ATP-binding protein [Gemmatimonadaceae bacterium]